MRLPISAFIICQDEERFIKNCIRSLHMCREIIIVDSGSTDRTAEIVQELTDQGYPIRFMYEKWRGYVGQKQFALEQCSGDWCLSIDSDERVSENLAAALPDLIAQSDVDGWQLTRYPYLNGYGYVPPRAHERYHNRLFRKGSGSFDPTDKVHEGITIKGGGEVKRAIKGGLLHFRPIKLHEQLLKENKYSTLKAQMKRERGIPANQWKMLVNPSLFFLKLYFRHGLWRCGWAGFIKARTGAFYCFLTEAKRWEAEAMDCVAPVEPTNPKGY